ncbi:MAG: DUF6455 family protein [Geminicoccaceae bacterium]
MLTFEDCVGLCGLSAEEVAAIARHEHLPEIVALELGAGLARTSRGKRAIADMIRDDITVADEKGDAHEAARLGGVLRRFVRGDTAGRDLEHRLRALGFDDDGAVWVQRRVESYMAAMGRVFGVEVAGLHHRFPLEMLAAETRCAACEATARCRRFLAGADDEPREFCPNAGALTQLRATIAPV